MYNICVFEDACVAQLAEQLTRNEQVVRSNRITSSSRNVPEGTFLFSYATEVEYNKNTYDISADFASKIKKRKTFNRL